ncbi:MAG: helix-turn-helix domain-containing protein [Fibrobacter sp.]|nr:helix-turn-helix domain-containing protein [Fibrobacter sp.]
MTKKKDDYRVIFTKELGITFKKWRNKAQKTQDYVGDYSDVSRVTIGKWESGKNIPDLFDFYQALKQISTNPSEFWTDFAKSYEEKVAPKLQVAERRKKPVFWGKTPKKPIPKK